MKILISLTFFVLSCSYTMAQDNIVNINFEVDGKPVGYKDAALKFILNKDTISTIIQDGKLNIPLSVFKKRATVIFYINQYFLKFDSIPITLNTLSPKWTIGVDKKPFNKETSWTGKSWKNVEIVYYLKNDDGRILIVDSYKKSTVIRS